MTLSELFSAVRETTYFHMGEAHGSYRWIRRGAEALLLFEWSNGLTDWKNNLALAPATFCVGDVPLRVHGGFLRSYESVRERVRAAIADGGLRQLIIGGYSHGAALAMLAHADTYPRRRAGTLAVGTVGFGAARPLYRLPPPGMFDGCTVVLCGYDIVGHLPPRLLGYRHTVPPLRLPTVTHTPIGDHRPTSYAHALDGAAGQQTVTLSVNFCEKG